MMLTYDEIVSELVRVGVPRDKAEAQAQRQVELHTRVSSRTSQEKATPTEPLELAREIRVRLPWSVMIPDNEKHGVINGRIILQRKYRQAKERARELAAEQVTATPYPCPVALVARVWEPTRARKRDLSNWAKITHDALIGIAFDDDALIDDVRWIRAGVDVDAPRVEFTVTPLLTRSA